jgi:L-asparaginase
LSKSRRILVVGAGGTIAMEGAHPFDWIDYGDTGIVHTIGTVLGRLQLGLDEIELLPLSVRALPSTGITPLDWCALAQQIDAALTGDASIDGVVITHGTASLEETAFFLHLVHRHRQPLVVVGAQRPPNTQASDAPANLRAAIACAADERLRDCGAFVVMNDTLHAAAEVTKTANFDLDAFQSPEFGPLGKITADARLTLARQPISATTGVFASLPLNGTLPRVDVVYSYAGADGVAIDAFIAAGARGIVSVGFPPGRCTPAERAALLRARAAGVWVVQSSRALRGRVPDQAYNRNEGILGGGGLSPGKARILLMLSLTTELPPEKVQALLLSCI